MNAPDSVKDRIIAEATRLFGERGYGSTSVRELVEGAGVTKPTLYYHFGSKEGLFLATAEAHLEALDAKTQCALSIGDTLSDQLASLVRLQLEYARARPDVLRFLMTCLHQVDHGQPQIDMMSLDATLVRHLGAAFYAAAERGEIASDANIPVAVVSFLGVLRAWTLGAFHGAPVPDNIHRTVVHHFLNGINPR